MIPRVKISPTRLLARFYQPLVLRNTHHRYLRGVWMVIYFFVAIQMAWVLRPFIGEPGTPPQFLRENIFSENAYQVVLRLVWGILGDGLPQFL